MLAKKSYLNESHSVLEIKTVLNPPIKLNFVDYVECPICQIEIDIYDKIIDNKSFARCHDCNHTIHFTIVNI
jgi:hypothetical protein